MFFELFILLVGLGVIIKGGDLFVSASIRIAQFLRLPRVVTGSTLVSLATTSPELVVSITAGVKGESGIALGNAVGSAVCNIGLVLATTAALKHITVHPSELRLPLTAMLLLGVVLFVITLDLRLSRMEGAILLAVGVGYFVYDFFLRKRDVDPQDVAEAVAIEGDITAGHTWLNSRLGTSIQFCSGAGLVILGSRLLVDSAVVLAERLGISPLVIALTIIAVGTSLPELVTAISSSRQDVSDLAVGNVLGANIANLSLIVGTAASIDEVSMSRTTQLFNFPALLILMGGIAFLVLRKGTITRRAGATLLFFYLLYLAGILVLNTVMPS
ncbi:MAG TPA: calcium/sodium antiporter [Candidatus Udaeobacter sp.]|jgi:cation:H+ antiporter|nr:calcium/sodium antiporter [Candidatus Udaeobacter sp.]